MGFGNVLKAIGTGLRQISGIFSVTDVSGNNIATFTSNNIVFGNTIDVPAVNFIAPNVQLTGTGNNPSLQLTQPSAPPDQKNTLIRLGGGQTGALAISSSSDAAPLAALSNLMTGNRSGTNWSSLAFGGSGDTFPVNFTTSGQVAFNGTIQVNNGINTIQSSVGGANSGSPVNIIILNSLPAFSVWYVFATLASSQDAVNYNAVSIVSTCGPTTVKATALQTAGFLTINASFSGSTLLFQVTQSSGNNNQTINFSALRVV